MFQTFPVMRVFDTITQSFFDTRKTLYLKQTPAKLLKPYLKDNGNIYLVYIYSKLFKWFHFQIKSSSPSRKIRSYLKVLDPKVDINLLNQYYKPADWLAEWLAVVLRHFDSKGTKGTKGTRSLEHLRHSRNSRHSGTQRALGHSGTQGT